ncbi:MAG: metalloregulator ArsR/SmtB family transcription factor [Myxococcales bacterium]|nr:metalloregulator ArsR/SmtB family transcription factor [Myxococcota bacterium]MDW8282155.1 metalloregulator ArsR/SmtB family transcription factor [Myxococcales bacterium]
MSSRAVACKELAVLLSVLSHPYRVRIVLELREGERDVGTLQEALGTSHSAVSQHLAVLRSHRLVAERRAGRHVFYRLCQPDLARWLREGLRLLQRDLHVSAEVRAAIEAAANEWTS